MRSVGGTRIIPVAAPAADHLPHHHPCLCKDCNAQIDAAVNAVIALIDAGKFDDAEARRLGMIHQARGDNRQAVEYYRKVVVFAREDPSLYDPQFPGYYRDRIDRLDPMAAR